MKWILCVLMGLQLIGGSLGAVADELSSQEMKSLDGEVQEIKSDVLAIASELNLLEEKLLFPSSTQLAVFLTLEPEEDFRLDAVRVGIDGEIVTHHIYSFKELDALRNGGVQRVFSGNVPTGEHEIEITMIGKSRSGSDFSRSEKFTFAKDIEPKAVGITLAGPGLTHSGIRLGDW